MKSLKNSKVLVTGANGFIGSHLTEKLVNLEAKVSIIVRPNSNLENLKNITNKINVFKGHLNNYEEVKKIVDEVSPEFIFHLAANVNASRDLNEIDKSIENISMTLNLLKALENKKYELFINTGTIEEYGKIKVPFKESDLPSPVSPYSASKLAITNYCRMLYETHGLPITTVRVFLTYGPKQKYGMFIPDLINSALLKKEFKMTKGEQTREFNYIDDIVNGYIKVASSEKSIGQVINIGNGKEYKIVHVVDLILKLMGNPIKTDKSLPHRKGEIMRVYCDN